ncbi:hypothetical protein HMSSN036_33590 [Paenibacillus macerans]|nr:hypothetical protein HMSSN036_33590 [Paenibacillus macerans]
MMVHTGRKAIAKITSIAVVLAVVVTGFPLEAQAGDTWPFQGGGAHGANQPSVHGYTSGHIMNWSPETDPGAELLRSHVPLQKESPRSRLPKPIRSSARTLK